MGREVVVVDKPWVAKVPFAQGVIASGRLLFTSGITARDRDGKLVAPNDVEAQIEKCFENLGDVLRQAGADFSDVVKYTMYTTDIAAFQAAGDAWHRHFVDDPGSTLVEVSALVIPEMVVEIEAVVALP
jgi:enamine deaminase RidA (YjgF/YER057c/UK114 family)